MATLGAYATLRSVGSEEDAKEMVKKLLELGGEGADATGRQGGDGGEARPSARGLRPLRGRMRGGQGSGDRGARMVLPVHREGGPPYERRETTSGIPAREPLQEAQHRTAHVEHGLRKLQHLLGVSLGRRLQGFPVRTYEGRRREVRCGRDPSGLCAVS